jgi:hypothetical protein
MTASPTLAVEGLRSPRSRTASVGAPGSLRAARIAGQCAEAMRHSGAPFRLRVDKGLKSATGSRADESVRPTLAGLRVVKNRVGRDAGRQLQKRRKTWIWQFKGQSGWERA